MKLSYKVMMVFLSVLFLVSLSLGQEVGDLMWEDLFNEPDTDPGVLYNVGWWYYGENDGLFGQITVNDPGNYVSITTGSFGGIVGAGLIQTNGVAALDTTDDDGTDAAIKENNYSEPNQQIVTRINLKDMGEYSTLFIGTRMVMMDSSESWPDADPTESPAYVLQFNPAADYLMIAKYPAAEYAALNPALWDTLVGVDFDLALDVWYWVKFYLFEGELKAKVWDGLPMFEPNDWTLSVVDAEPRVTGRYTMFATFNGVVTTGGDVYFVDEIKVYEVPGGASAIDDGAIDLVPQVFNLGANYPNPFNPETTIDFSLEKSDNVTLKVYSITGQLVRTLVNNSMAAGSHQVTFNGQDDLGNALASGVYFYQLQSSENVATHKMILMK